MRARERWLFALFWLLPALLATLAFRFVPSRYNPELGYGGLFLAHEHTLENFRTIDSIARGAGGRSLFSTFQFRDGDDANLALFNARLRAFFSAQGFSFVDQAELIPDHDAALQTDECPFTPEGRKLLTRNFFDAIVARGDLDGLP